MTDHLVVVSGLKGPQFAIYRDELPGWWNNREKLYGAGQCFSRPLTNEDVGLSIAHLERRWREAKQPLPSAIVAASKPITGTYIGIPALKQLLAWGLLCQGIVGKNDDFDVLLTAGGVIVKTRGK